MSCTVVEVPKAKADDCNPDINFAQVTRVYVGNSGNPFTDWTSLAEWTPRLDQAAAGADKIRTFNVIGSKPKPDRPKVAFSRKRTAYGDPKHSLPFKVDETHPDNYAFLKFLEDHPGQRNAVWYEIGKYLYGGNAGVDGLIILDDTASENDEELNVFEGEITWEGKHPDRIVNPLI